VYEGSQAVWIVFGKHLYGGGKFFIKAGNETGGLIRLGFHKLDLIGVKGQAFDEGLFGLVFSEAVTSLVLREKERSAAAI